MSRQDYSHNARSAKPGLVCPNCQHPQLKTVRTKRGDGKNTRRRECKKCGHRVRTGERIEDDGMGGVRG